MVEPAGSILFNTLLQGRSTLALNPASIYSASKAMPRTSRVLTPGFFNPQPRRVKGKERMSDPSCADVLSVYSAQCREWSCRMRISVYCSGRLDNEVVVEEETRKRSRGNVRRTRKTAFPLPRHPPGAISLQRGQARHASHTSDRPSPDSDPPSSSADSSGLHPPKESAAASDNPSFHSVDESADDLDLSSETPDVEPPLLDNISETHSPPTPESSSAVVLPSKTTGNEFREGDILYLQRLIAEPTIHLQPDKIWHAYETVEAHAITSSERLMMAEKLLIWAESRNQIDDLDELHKWGARIGRILYSIDPAATPALLFRSLTARTLALEGDLQEAFNIIRSEPPHYDEFDTYLRAYESILVSIWRHFDRISAVEFLILEWKTLGSYLLTETSRIHSASLDIASAAASLRKTAFAVASGISLPSLAVADKQEEWDVQQRQHLGDFLIEAFLRHKLPMEAVDILKEMRRQKVKPAWHIPLIMVRALARDNMYAEAHTLYASIEQEKTYDYLYTGLYLHAHEGQEKQALEYFDRISASGWTNSRTIMMLISSPKTRMGCQLIHPRSRTSPSGSWRMRNGGEDDSSGIDSWVQTMNRAGLKPDVYVFTTILKNFALRGDLESIARGLDRMRAQGHPPNVVTYTTVMTLLAHRKDPASTEAIYSRAIKDGIVPDSMMIATLMNAHIEAGSWKGVIRVFDFVQSSPHMRLTIGIYNLLLKAYVQIGAPFRTVSRIFNQLEPLRLRPDAYTFALLIQSACDSRKMKAASDIFTHMEKLAEQWGSSRHITAWTMTIIMAGFLRMGDHKRAMTVYEDMISRGLKPTAVTYGVIISAYGREGTEESFKLAEQFIESITTQDDRTWARPAHGRLSARDHLYLPLMQSFSRRQGKEDAERVYNKMLTDGGIPTLSLLSALLDTYIRTNDIDSARQLWPQLFETGVKYSTVPLFKDESDDQRGSKIHTFVLCQPLSRYMEGLSRAGRHDEIASVWKTFQTHGFSFSSDNWNQLALALLQAGDVERGFEVLERVLIPYHRQNNRLRRERDLHPSSPLSLDVPPTERMPLEKPLEGKAREAATRVSRFHRRAGPYLDDPDHAKDLAYQLHILHRISPMWNTWRPRHDVLGRLLGVVQRLRVGYPADAEERQRDELSLDPDEFHQQREDAFARLRGIYETYPEAAALVERFERKERRRMGRWFTGVYKWATTDR
ncbi:hypothetical protein MSAN_01476200 [Mycena sanguinolenta]|uniref:Pentatricopeptide repeat-containing protein n=1 Tax=Mycena sanguinolenta TaxID=230812 RepID=A0A8H6Y791_9AGAR|nr:hypothetical protein MSAN_01476200 [Mycena sanguinolenta]